MKIILDLDGTLVPCEPTEEVCFGAACQAVLGVMPARIWAPFPLVTDLGILRTIALAHLGRQPTEDEVTRFSRCYAAMLWDAVRASPTVYRTPVAGARALLTAPREDWKIDIATGNLRNAALIKLQASGLHVEGTPMVCAEDAEDRLGLARRCADLLGVGVERTVLVGDAVWDVQTAREIGLPFVGVALDPSAEVRLRFAGATMILPDFGDSARVRHALDEARVPGD